EDGRRGPQALCSALRERERHGGHLVQDEVEVPAGRPRGALPVVLVAVGDPGGREHGPRPRLQPAHHGGHHRPVAAVQRLARVDEDGAPVRGRPHPVLHALVGVSDGGRPRLADGQGAHQLHTSTTALPIPNRTRPIRTAAVTTVRVAFSTGRMPTGAPTRANTRAAASPAVPYEVAAVSRASIASRPISTEVAMTSTEKTRAEAIRRSRAMLTRKHPPAGPRR